MSIGRIFLGRGVGIADGHVSFVELSIEIRGREQ
jgi:hypothetical protein